MNPVISLYLSAGLSVIPIRPDGSKAATISWQQYQEKRANGEAESWGLPIALIGGKISGGLVCIDFDDSGSQFDGWKHSVSPELLKKLVVQKTPSGGFHCLYRTEKPVRNIKLAKKNKAEVLIETRGEGGYFLCAPSDGYKIIYGAIDKIQTITDDEQQELLNAAKALNQYSESEPEKLRIGTQGTDISPGDAYDEKNTPIQVLEKHGWTIVRSAGDITWLRRPGKKEGISASWNKIPGRLYCFTTSTEFENEKVYKPWHVYSVLEHNGDFKKAASDLYNQGYGRKLAKEKPVQEEIVIDRAPLVSINTLKERMLHYRMFGADDRGISTGWPELDYYYRPAKGMFTVVTGIPSHGKSEIMDAMIINTAKENQWRWIIYSPENYPFERHLRKLIEKKANTFFPEIDDITYGETFQWLDRQFKFIEQSLDGTRLSDVLGTTEKIIDTWHPDAILIDPWNELWHEHGQNDSETNYIGKQISLARSFSRQHDIAFFVIAHPTKLQKNRDTKKYDPPTPYDISGSSHWYNKCDNAICIHRDFSLDITSVIVQKIKFKMYGKVGSVNFKYNVGTGNYTAIQQNPDYPESPCNE